MRILRTVACLFLLVGTFTHGTDCTEELKRIAKEGLARPYFMSKKRLPQEIAGAHGQRLLGWTKPRRANDLYLYIIDDEARAWLTSVYPGVSAAQNQFIGNHPGLRKQREKDLGRAPKGRVVAAGEFRLSNGVVVELNNRSGSIRGKTPHLIFAELFFRSVEIPISVNLKRMDYSDENSDLHGLRAEHMLQANEEWYQTLYKRYDRALQDYRELFPHPIRQEDFFVESIGEWQTQYLEEFEDCDLLPATFNLSVHHTSSIYQILGDAIAKKELKLQQIYIDQLEHFIEWVKKQKQTE